MDKIKLEFKAPENKKITYNGISIEVIPTIDFIKQAGFINQYIVDYFGQVENKIVLPSPYNYIEAEYNLKVYVIQTVTNIEVDSLSMEIISDENLWNEIIKNVSNYSDFRKRLDYVVEEIKDEIRLKRSVGGVIEQAAGKLSVILEMFSSLSPEEIKDLQKEGASLLSQLEKSDINLAADVSKPNVSKPKISKSKNGNK